MVSLDPRAERPIDAAFEGIYPSGPRKRHLRRFPLMFTAAQSLAQVQVSLYSPRSNGGFRNKLPGRDSWWGPLWIDHREIGQIIPGKFLILKIPEGDHSFAGERAVNGVRFGVARESSIQTVISFHQRGLYSNPPRKPHQYRGSRFGSCSRSGYLFHKRVPQRGYRQRLLPARTAHP
jgi:hypothetical protein